MSAYAVLGLSGTGKSTLVRGLNEHGYVAIDADSFASYQNIASGQTIPRPYVTPFTAEFLDSHIWVWDPAKVHAAIKAATTDLVICGDASNASDFYPLFKKIVGLVADDKTLTDRLRGREPERWAEGSPDLARKLERNKNERQRLQAIGAVLVDASQTPDKVLQDVLHELYGSGESEAQ